LFTVNPLSALIAWSITLILFTFLAGRRFRRLPLIDDCMLPRVMCRDATTHTAGTGRVGAGPEQSETHTSSDDKHQPYPSTLIILSHPHAHDLAQATPYRAEAKRSAAAQMGAGA
jgi:hypothetical protein